MNRKQLEHLIRAAGGNADCADIVIIGSQAILGSISEPPEALLVSMEADVFPRDDPEGSILIDGAIGERSVFHETFGYYAHGVDASTAILPEGWQERLVPLRNENTRGVTGWCLEISDLAISKLAAGRPKDMDYLRILAEHGFVQRDVLLQRLGDTPRLEAAQYKLCRQRIDGIQFKD